MGGLKRRSTPNINLDKLQNSPRKTYRPTFDRTLCSDRGPRLRNEGMSNRGRRSRGWSEAGNDAQAPHCSHFVRSLDGLGFLLSLRGAPESRFLSSRSSWTPVDLSLPARRSQSMVAVLACLTDVGLSGCFPRCILTLANPHPGLPLWGAFENHS